MKYELFKKDSFACVKPDLCQVFGPLPLLLPVLQQLPTQHSLLPVINCIIMADLTEAMMLEELTIL